MIGKLLSGETLTIRALRGAAITLFGYGGSQVIRLAANLILTRLLFPEAFGLMALVQVVMIGVVMFSDVGITPSILQSKRGDDPEFLDTAWTIQVIRGILLWLAASALAWPVAAFYQEPQLTALIPAAAVSLLIMGFNPTRVDTANRHLMLGRITSINMAAQAFGILIAIWAAFVWQSVWALVLGGVATSAFQLVAYMRFLPGQKNRFRWEPRAADELVRFGFWIFFSTIAGFLYTQGDRAIIGKYLTIEQLGIYNVGYFMGSFPVLLGAALVGKMMIPLYRERPPAASRENFLRHRKMRGLLTLALLAISGLLALVGVWLMQTIYDPRYALAGPVLVLIASIQMVPIISMTYDQAALAAGDSRRFFVLSAAKAGLMIAGLLVGILNFGLLGALGGQFLGMVLSYPVTVWLARRQGAWDPLHDLVMGGLAAGLAAIAILWNLSEISLLAGL